MLADIDAVRGETLGRKIGARFVACDVSDSESWSALFGLCLVEVGIPDYVHLNGGIMSVPPSEPFVPIDRLSLEQYRRLVTMAPSVMAREVADLLVAGANGEVRLELSEKKPAYAIEARELVYA